MGRKIYSRYVMACRPEYVSLIDELPFHDPCPQVRAPLLLQTVRGDIRQKE